MDFGISHHRGRERKAGLVEAEGTTINYFQDDVSTAIKQFTKGKITSAEFKAKLGDCEVKIDDTINKMILRH